MGIRSFSILVSLSFVFSFTQAKATTFTEDLIGNLYAMKSVYKAGYAPAVWKKRYAGYDLETSFQEALNRIQENPSLTQYEAWNVFEKFIYDMKDYHVSISFLSTEQASLPFLIKEAGGRYFLGYIDRTKLSPAAFPFNVGDEVLFFDGKPTSELVAELMADKVSNVERTDRSMATMLLTRRLASRGYQVPQGPVSVGIRTKGAKNVSYTQLIWDYTPERVSPREFPSRLQTTIGKSMLEPMMDVDPIIELEANNPYALGARKTFTPDLGTKIWESEDTNTFYAYIYQTEDRRLVGYLRLPSYVVSNAAKSVADFASIVKRFEAVTDAMVIDQVNNPGGSVFYLYALASMLTDQPLRTPLHRMTVDQSSVVEMLALEKSLEGVKNDDDARKALGRDEIGGIPVTYQIAQFQLNFARFIINEWKAGRKLSTPYWIGGVNYINPSPTRYTKPILLLVNELDFSGGDFFPAILQDNKRVTVMGSRTAGAGGYVISVNVPNNVGVETFRLTGSIAERVNGNPIENLGVEPDVPYEMTAEDLIGNYGGYVSAVKKEVGHLIDCAAGKIENCRP